MEKNKNLIIGILLGLIGTYGYFEYTKEVPILPKEDTRHISVDKISILDKNSKPVLIFVGTKVTVVNAKGETFDLDLAALAKRLQSFQENKNENENEKK